MKEPQNRFVADAERNHAENDRAGEHRKLAEFAGTERKARILCMTAREQIGQTRESQRGDMGSHVPAIGDQRDRAEQRATDDFGDHHGGRKRNHAPGAPFMMTMTLAKEGVIVRPGGMECECIGHLFYYCDCGHAESHCPSSVFCE